MEPSDLDLWQAFCNRRRRQASCRLPSTITWHRFLLRRDTSLGVTVRKMLKSGVYHLRLICRVYVHVRIKFSASRMLVVPFFFFGSCHVQQIRIMLFVFFFRALWCSHFCTNSPSSMNHTSIPAGLNGSVGLWHFHLFLWSPLLPSLTSYKHLEHSKRSVCTFSSYELVSFNDCRDCVSNTPRLLIIVSACPWHSPQCLIASQQIHHHLINMSGNHISEH